MLEGELDVLYEDNDSSSRLLHFLHSDNRRIPLKFLSGPPDLPSGSHIQVSGDLADGTLNVTVVSAIAVSSTRTMGTQDVLVILMNFANDSSQPFSASIIGGINTQVQNFYLENSYGQTTLNFSVTGWYTIAASNNPVTTTPRPVRRTRLRRVRE